MLIKDMSHGEQQRVLKWCRSHDWGTGAKLSEKGLLTGITEYCPMMGKKYSLFFSCHETLRSWAGY